MSRFQAKFWLFPLSLAPVLTAHAVELTENGRASAVIVVSKNALAPEKFAAQELQCGLARLSGATLPIQNTAPVKGTFVSLEVQPAGVFAADADPDALFLRAKGNGLLVAGNSPRGTLYATYALLEKLGVRYFAPDFAFYAGKAELYPPQKTLRLSDFEARESPSLKYRRKYVEEGWSHTLQTLPKLIDWLAKKRLNVLVHPYNYQNAGRTRWDAYREQILPEIQKRGLWLEVGGHGYQSFLPPATYKEAHPDWFIEGFNVFNIENEAALETYVSNVVAYLKTRPEIRIFDAWPPDGAKWAPQLIEKYGSIPNAEAHVTRALSARLQKELPGVSVESVSYVPAIEPPDAPQMLDPHAFVNYAMYGRSYRDLIFEGEFAKNKTYNAILSRWRDNGFKGNAGVYEYYRKYAWHSLPVALPKLISAEVPHYVKQGYNGLGFYSEPADWITYELNHALVADLSWNANQDAKLWLSNYLSDRFGTAAPALARYYEAVENGSRALLHRLGGGDYDNAESVAKTREGYLEAQKALEDARRLAPTGSNAAFLVERLSWNLDYALASTDIARFSLAKDDAQAQDAKNRLSALLERHRFDGILLQNTYSARRYAASDTPADREERRARYFHLYHQTWR